MTEDTEIPDRHTARIASDLNNSIGFVCEEANRLYALKNGRTALFWHLVAVIQQHTKPPQSGAST